MSLSCSHYLSDCKGFDERSILTPITRRKRKLSDSKGFEEYFFSVSQVCHWLHTARSGDWATFIEECVANVAITW